MSFEPLRPLAGACVPASCGAGVTAAGCGAGAAAFPVAFGGGALFETFKAVEPAFDEATPTARALAAFGAKATANFAGPIFFTASVFFAVPTFVADDLPLAWAADFLGAGDAADLVLAKFDIFSAAAGSVLGLGRFEAAVAVRLAWLEAERAAGLSGLDVPRPVVFNFAMRPQSRIRGLDRM